MKKLTKEQIEIHESKVRDTSLPLAERRASHKKLIENMMNPKEQFDPAKFDPMDAVADYEVKKRDRVEPPERLETMGMFPKELFKGQMIGMFESKQELYLTMAYYINKILDKMDSMQVEIDALKSSKDNL